MFVLQQSRSPLHIDLAILTSTAISAHLAAGCRGPALHFAGLAVFVASVHHTSRKLLACPLLHPLLTVALKWLSMGPNPVQKCLGEGAEEGQPPLA